MYLTEAGGDPGANTMPGDGPGRGNPFSTPNDHDVWQIAGNTGDEGGRAGRILKNPSARSRCDDAKREVEIPSEPSINAAGFDTILNERAGREVREQLKWHSRALADALISRNKKRVKKTDALNACFCTGV